MSFICFATRPARQALAHARRHRARRPAQSRRQGLIGLGAGEPDFDTPAHIAAGRRRCDPEWLHALHQCRGHQRTQGRHHRQVQARQRHQQYERPQILVSSGAKQTIFNLCMAVLDPGDEAIIPAPYWVSYPDMVLLADGLPVMPFAGPEQGYKITPRQLAAAITPKTRLVLLNSPSNPTGAAYTRAELRALGEVLLEHPRILIGTDDMYEKIYWGTEPFCSLLTAVPELYDRTVTINGCSKALRDDRLAHRLLRRTEGDHHRDGHDPGPVDLQCLQHLAESGDRRAQRRSELRRHDEPRLQGAPRFCRRGLERPCPA